MSRYPICHHTPHVRVSSHEDLAAAATGGGPMASTYCCNREACLEDAQEWVRATTRLSNAVVVPLPG